MIDSVPEAAQCERALIEIATESWRLSRLFVRILSKLDAGEGARHLNQLRYAQKRIEESLELASLKLVNVEGHVFDSGMAAEAINAADFQADEKLLVDQMVEPIIMGPDGVKKQGTVLLRRAAL